MSPFRCGRQAEVREVSARGQWPHGCAEELRAHVSECQVCGDIVLVRHAFAVDRANALHAPQLPPAGLIWWRAQLRQRQVGLDRVSRPMLGAQVFAFSVCLLVAAILVISQAGHGMGWLSWFSELPRAQAFRFDHLLGIGDKSNWTALLVAPGIALLAIVSGLVLFFSGEKR